METVAAVVTPVVEQNTKAFLDALATQNAPPIYKLSIEDARNALLSVQAVDVEKMPADIEDHVLAIDEDNKINIRIVRPQGSTQALPIIMYFHGGGWVLGDKTTHDRLIRDIANGANAAIVFVDYTRSPEAHYSVAIEEAYAATKWIAENGKTFNLDTSRMAVVGESVGGNMAAVTAIMCKERGGPKIDLQVLLYPVTDANFDTQSYHQFAEGYWLTREAMKWFWDKYAPDMDTRTIPTVSPLRASIEQLKGLPPTLLITDECDVLRDEGEAYARKLMQAGVPVMATRYLGTIHDFVLLNPIANTPATRGAIAEACNMIKKAFGQ